MLGSAVLKDHPGCCKACNRTFERERHDGSGSCRYSSNMAVVCHLRLCPKWQGRRAGAVGWKVKAIAHRV